jgi:DNA primase
MQIPLEFYEHLRDQIKISDVIRQKIPLAKKSGEYIGLCPFHNEKSPSFTVSDIKRFYHCFGCGAHGDVIKFISATGGFSYRDSAIKLANDYNIAIPKLSKAQEKLYEESDEIYGILQKALEFFKSELTAPSINYLKSRKISENAIKEFDIGFAKGDGKLIEFFKNSSIPIVKLANAGLIGKKQDDRIYEVFHNRIIFPIKNIYNKVVGFGARVIDDSMPKYLNSPETIVFKKNEVLYGEDKAIASAYKKNYIILVEGYLDAIALWSAGFTETVASLGTAVTQNHIYKLWKYCDEIILCLDGDNAGVRATKRVIELALPLINHQRKISFVRLPIGLDPDDTLKKHGNEFFENLVKDRMGLSNMIWNLEYEEINPKTPEEQAMLQAKLEGYCAKLTDKTLLYSYRRFFKDQVWNYLFRNKKTKTTSNVELTREAISEIEALERGLCALLIKSPQILAAEYIKDFFLNSNFRTQKLSEFKCWFFEQFTDIKNLQVENIKQEIERTGFFKIYNLLSALDGLSLDISSDKNIDYILLFEILQKKYYLVLLKEECALIIQNNTSQSFAKINKYREEMLKVSSELQELMESFITKKG